MQDSWQLLVVVCKIFLQELQEWEAPGGSSGGASLPPANTYGQQELHLQRDKGEYGVGGAGGSLGAWAGSTCTGMKVSAGA